MQDSRRSHLLHQEWWTMLGRTHWVERLGLWWCSGVESGVIQSHHCPVRPCSASYSSLQSQLHACRASQSSFPGNRKCSPSPSVSLRLPIAFLAGWWYQHSVSWAHCLWQPFSWRHWCPENLPWGPTSKSGPSNIPVQELVSFVRILLLLPCAIVYDPQFGCLLVSTHPMKKADYGGTTPYWLGAPQLKVGESCPVRFKNLFDHRKQPLSSWWTPIEQWLITGNSCFLCCVNADGNDRL